MILLATYVVTLAFVALGGLCVALGPRNGVPLIGAASFAAAALLVVASWMMARVVFDDDAYLHDFFTVLETINRTVTGLASSSDYLSPIGPIYDWVFRISLWLRPPSATTLSLANAVFAAIAALYGVLLLRRQVSFATLGLVTLIAVATIVSPRDLDRIVAQTQMNWLAPYNRWASGLVVLPVMALCVPALRPGWFRALLLGVGIAALMLIKITYGAALLGLLAVAVVLRTLPLLQAIAAVVAAAVTLALLDLATAGQIRAYARDIATVAAMPSNGLRIAKFILQFGEAFIWAGASILFYIAACRMQGRRWEIRVVALILIAATMGCTILMQNHWFSESTIYAVLPLVAAEWSGIFRTDERHSTPGSGARHATLVGVAAGLALIYPARDSGTLIAQHVQARRLPPDQTLAAYPRANFVVPDRQILGDGSLTAIQYRYMVEGLEALRQAGTAQGGDGSVLALYFANPYPFLLERPSPRGAPIWLDEGRTFTEELHLSNEEIFGGVETVMRSSDPRHGRKLWEIYGSYVEEHFDEVARVGSWSVYVRKP